MACNHLPVCCCGDSGIDQEDPRQALLDTICGFYVEALDRLPIHDYPNLVHCLFVAGHCYGLLEPVSNIILHAIAHGPSDQGPYKREDITSEFLNKIHNRWYWLRTAESSLDGLTAFLMSWYRYLTSDQAVRYLYLAKADIYFAMDLVEREFHKQCLVEEALPPTFDDDAWILTIKNSLMYAALAAEHPNPDGLVALATETFGADHVDKIAAWLHANQVCKIAVDDIYSSLMYGRTPDSQYLYSLPLSYPDDTVVPIATCQNLNTCIHRCSSLLKGQVGWDPAEHDVSPCDYIKRIEALLVDYINALHLSAISRLSPASAMVLHHGLVVAGYLYGPLEDPVFNILLNAIWYQLHFPACENENCVPSLPMDMICTDRMLRNGFNALTGQVVFLCSKYSMLSGHNALEYLYFTNCNLRVAAELAERAGHHAVSSSDLSTTEAAVKAMKHPRQAAMMAFMTSLTPALEAKLCDLLPAKGHELSSEAIDHISMLLYSHATLPIFKSPPAVMMMHQRALAEITEERRAFKKKQRFLMDVVRPLLDTNYKVDTICAVAKSNVWKQEIYHINFLAMRMDVGDRDQDKRVLFFAQFFPGVYSRRTQWENFNGKNWVRSFCCPVTISAFLGRCFLCEFRRAKIVHPICVGMEYYGRQEAAYLNFMNYVASNPHRVYNYKMESDFVYFDPSINTELAKYLNECARKEEEMTEEEAHEAFLKSIPIG
ncbi:unnamed protein product [Urochloa decumbens]|uniref:Uncharacterized protein n=1 Tax=Urochloa decumbens TaxID=240449 RepID=A0ABC8WAV8_9POAL